MSGQSQTGAGATVSQLSARADAASAGMSGDVANASMSCPDVVLQLGVFFDGTGNNRDNAGGTGEGSYANDLSNVAKLEPLYYGRNRDLRNACGGYAVRYDSLYVQGIGTTSGADDSMIGGGTGTGDTGVENRVFEAAIQIGTIINRLSPGIEPREVIMDVFGFSRGAAAARHFVNAFRRGYLNYRRVLQRDRRAYLPEGRNIRFRFVGLFDTVASIQLGGGANNHGALNLNLSGASADHVFHLTAQHEIRHNFPLSNTAGAGTSRVMPGVHSDIGGGYRDSGDDVIVAMPLSYIETTEAAAQAKRSSELRRLNATRTTAAAPYIAEGYISAADAETALVFEASPIKRFVIPTFPFPLVQYDFKINTRLRRPWVRPDMSKISLHVMHKTATDNQVPFEPISNAPQYAWPSDPVFRAAAAQMKAGGAPSGPQLAHLLRNYMHHSAHFNDIYPVVGAPMRPAARRVRRVIVNQPGQAD